MPGEQQLVDHVQFIPAFADLFRNSKASIAPLLPMPTKGLDAYAGIRLAASTDGGLSLTNTSLALGAMSSTAGALSEALSTKSLLHGIYSQTFLNTVSSAIFEASERTRLHDPARASRFMAFAQGIYGKTPAMAALVADSASRAMTGNGNMVEAADKVRRTIRATLDANPAAVASSPETWINRIDFAKAGQKGVQTTFDTARNLGRLANGMGALAAFSDVGVLGCSMLDLHRKWDSPHRQDAIANTAFSFSIAGGSILSTFAPQLQQAFPKMLRNPTQAAMVGFGMVAFGKVGSSLLNNKDSLPIEEVSNQFGKFSDVSMDVAASGYQFARNSLLELKEAILRQPAPKLEDVL